jgi:group I intron endonuclease
MENKGEVYLITCKVNNKRYVGQAVCFLKLKSGFKRHGTDGRWKVHVASATRERNGCIALNSAIRKYGAHNFEVKPLIFCEIQKLNYYEVKFIREYSTLAPYGYNLKSGGAHGRQHPETIEKLRMAMSGAKHYMYGKKHTPETLEKLKSNHHHNVGRIQTPASRKAISIAKGRKESTSHLPMYVYTVWLKGIIVGYLIKYHPKLPTKTRKSFTSTKYTLEEKLQMAIKYIEILENPSMAQDVLHSPI